MNKDLNPWESPEYVSGNYRENPRTDYLVGLYVNGQFKELCDQGEELIEEVALLRAENERLRSQIYQVFEGWSSLDLFLVISDCYYTEVKRGEVSRITENKFKESRAEMARIREKYKINRPVKKESEAVTLETPKPCPICGRSPQYSCHNDRDYGQFYCRQTDHQVSGTWGVKSEALETWNKRL